MRLKRSNVFWTSIVMIICTWTFAGSPTNISLDLSIFCAKLTMILLAIWMSMGKDVT